MKKVHDYNIHNLIKLRIVRNSHFDLMRDINLRFSFFEVSKVNDPNLILNIGKFRPSHNGCVEIDHMYKIKKIIFIGNIMKMNRSNQLKN